MQIAQHAFGIDQHGVHEIGGFGEKVIEHQRYVRQELLLAVAMAQARKDQENEILAFTPA